jgi:RNA polymerase sigma-70 factor (ECF subfamily)
LKNRLPTYLDEKSLVKACKQREREAQNTLFKQYGSRMFAICKRYLKDSMEAEDVLMEGFLKIFIKISEFKEDGSLEGWMRKIMVNECLMILRKRKIEWSNSEEVLQISEPSQIMEQMSADEIQVLISKLPDGFRTVFNLYAIEGYSHGEIAEKLGISEGTSKSQLSRARVYLQQKINANES